MSHHLTRQLSTLYGVALFSNRQVTCVMESDPLIVDESESVERVATMTTLRDEGKAYDDIVVTRQSKFLERAAKVKKYAKSLTGTSYIRIVALRPEKKGRPADNSKRMSKRTFPYNWSPTRLQHSLALSCPVFSEPIRKQHFDLMNL